MKQIFTLIMILGLSLVASLLMAQCGTSFSSTPCETVNDGFIFDWGAGMAGSNPDGICDQGLHYTTGYWAFENFSSESYNGGAGACFAADANNEPVFLQSGDVYPTNGTWQCNNGAFDMADILLTATVGSTYYIPIRLEVKDMPGTYHYGWVALKVNSTDETDTGAITVDLSQSGATNVPGQIPMTVQCSELVLPVELVSFGAEASKEGTKLSWVTATEENNDRFEVEYSTDGKVYRMIASVEGNGTTRKMTQYEYVDKNSYSTPISYYRLKQVDYDGDYDYSPVVAIRSEKVSLETKVYPNPVSGDKVTIELASTSSSDASILVMNSVGQVVKQFTRQLSAGGSVVELGITDLESGVYLLHITHDGSNSVQKIKKN